MNNDNNNWPEYAALIGILLTVFGVLGLLAEVVRWLIA